MHEDKTLEERNASSKNAFEEITMTMVQTAYPKSIDTVDVTIKNNTSIEVYTGLDDYIEYYNGSTWGKIPLDFAVEAVAFSLLPQESKDFSIYLHPKQHDYQPGRYRICKSVSTTLQLNDPERRTYDLTAEFNME